MSNKTYTVIRNAIVVTNPKFNSNAKGGITKFYIENIRDELGTKNRFNMTAYKQHAQNCVKYLKIGSIIKEAKCEIKTEEIAGGKLYITEYVIDYIVWEDDEDLKMEEVI